MGDTRYWCPTPFILRIDFSTAINTVDPTTFGIPTDINTAFDRPALQSTINTLLGRVGNISQGFVQRGDAYAPRGTTLLAAGAADACGMARCSAPRTSP